MLSYTDCKDVHVKVSLAKSIEAPKFPTALYRLQCAHIRPAKHCASTLPKREHLSVLESALWDWRTGEGREVEREDAERDALCAEADREDER